MRKAFFFLAAILAVISCNKEPDAPSDNTVHLTFTGVTNDVKTSLASDFSVVWSTEDDITVFPGENAAGVTFDVSATSNNGHVATFEGNAAASATYYALSPAQVGVSISDGKISAILPTVQTAVAGSFGPEANVSVAVASDYVFQFKNVGAIVGITIGQSDITGLKLEALNGEVLSGTAVIDPADGSLVSKSGESYVQMNDNLAKDATYYFVVLPGTYAGGFRITLFKGAQYTRFSKTASYTIERNGNLDLGTYEGTNWKTAFVEGEEVVIKGSAEDGQRLAYVGADGYWNTSVTGNDVAGYAYNYEIFTQLTQNQKFYFKTAGGENHTLNAAGTAVEPLAKIANAPYGAPEDGIYRIRMSFPDGSAEVKRITEVKFSQYSVSGLTMVYEGNGVWSHPSVPMKRGGNAWDNRYKFNIHFADAGNQWYGRMNASGNPTYGVTDASYFHVQPSLDTDKWEPCFQWPSMYENNIDRYYGKVTLSMNNDGGHYTHAVSNIWDKQNPLVTGEAVRVYGSAVASPDVPGVQMRYSTSFYNSAVANYGDRVDGSSTMADPVGYDYEVFVKLSKDTKFYFSTESGHHFGINSTGDGIEGIFAENEVGYSGVSNDGVYRIRINSSNGAVALRRAESVRYLQPNRGTNQELSYIGNGIWRGYPAFGWTNPKGWGSNSICVFKFQIYFNETGTWQYYGRYETDQVYTSTHIQPITDTGTTASWNNFLTVENSPDYDSSEYRTEYGYCDMYLKLNAEGYTYQITNIRK